MGTQLQVTDRATEQAETAAAGERDVGTNNRLLLHTLDGPSACYMQGIHGNLDEVDILFPT